MQSSGWPAAGTSSRPGMPAAPSSHQNAGVSSSQPGSTGRPMQADFPNLTPKQLSFLGTETQATTLSEFGAPSLPTSSVEAGLRNAYSGSLSGAPQAAFPLGKPFSPQSLPRDNMASAFGTVLASIPSSAKTSSPRKRPNPFIDSSRDAEVRGCKSLRCAAD